MRVDQNLEVACVENYINQDQANNIYSNICEAFKLFNYRSIYCVNASEVIGVTPQELFRVDCEDYDFYVNSFYRGSRGLGFQDALNKRSKRIILLLGQGEHEGGVFYFPKNCVDISFGYFPRAKACVTVSHEHNRAVNIGKNYGLVFSPLIKADQPLIHLNFEYGKSK